MTYTPYLHNTHTARRYLAMFSHGCGTFFRMIVTAIQCPGFMDKRLKYVQSVGIDLLI